MTIETMTSGETLADVYASGVVPTDEQIRTWSDEARLTRDQAVTLEMAAGEAVLAADYSAALLVLVTYRAHESVRYLAESFAWLHGGSAKSSAAGSRTLKVAQAVRDGGGTLKWSHAWTADVAAGKAQTAAGKSDEEQAQRSNIAEQAGIALGTFDTLSSYASKDGVLARALAVDPTILASIPSDVLSKAATAARKAQAPESGDGEPGTGTDGDPLIPAIERVTAAVASLLRALDKSVAAEHTVILASLSTGLDDAVKGINKTRKAIATREAIADPEVPTE